MSVDWIDLLASIDGVQSAIWSPSPHHFRVESYTQGSATVARRLTPDGRWRLAYAPDDLSRDPFLYCGLGLCCADLQDDACYLTYEEWERATWTLSPPLAPFWVVKALSGDLEERADIVLVAAPGYGLMEDVRGDHGAMDRDSMWVPMLLSGSEIHPENPMLFPRVIDTAPTLMTLLGLPVPDGLAGRVLDPVRPLPQVSMPE